MTNSTASSGKLSHPSWPLQVSAIVNFLRHDLQSIDNPDVDVEKIQSIRESKKPTLADFHTKIEEVVIARLQNLVLQDMEPKDATGTFEAEWVTHTKNKNSFNDDAVVLYIHGGGYILMNRKTHRQLTHKIAEYSHCKVLAIDYRLSPEHVFPLALHDVLSAYSYLINDAKYDPSKIVFMGDSAGGGLAMAAILWLRDNGVEHGLPLPGGAALMSPWLDLTESMPSFKSNGVYDYLLDKGPDRILNENRSQYYVKDNSFLRNPLVSPLFATESDIPLCPILLQIGDAERFRDESLAFAYQKFPNAPIQLELYDAMPHVFQSFHPLYLFAKMAVERLGQFANSVQCGTFDEAPRLFTRFSNQKGFKRSLLTEAEIDVILDNVDSSGSAEDSAVLLIVQEIEADGKLNARVDVDEE